jgi:hypothetical protein
VSIALTRDVATNDPGEREPDPAPEPRGRN